MGGVLQAAKEGRSMRFAYVLIKVERGCVHAVANQLIELEEVSEVHSISGPHDLIAKVMVPTYDDLGAAIPEKIHGLQGIRDTETRVVFNVFK
jgi:DNA-binding Lrp family transcriptional regulator